MSTKLPNKSHKPTIESRNVVERMASIGIPQNKVADVIGVSEPTLRKHYRSELDGAAVRANVAVATNLFDIATSDGPRAVTAAIFWLKCRGGWREDAPEEQMDATELGRAMGEFLLEAERATVGERFDRAEAAKRLREEKERQYGRVYGNHSGVSPDNQNH